MVMLPSPSNLGGGLTRAGYHDFHSGSSTRDINFQVDRLTCSETYTTGQWLHQGGYNGFVAPVQTYGVDDLGAGNEELADLQLADLPAGDCLHPL